MHIYWLAVLCSHIVGSSVVPWPFFSNFLILDYCVYQCVSQTSRLIDGPYLIWVIRIATGWSRSLLLLTQKSIDFYNQHMALVAPSPVRFDSKQPKCRSQCFFRVFFCFLLLFSTNATRGRPANCWPRVGRARTRRPNWPRASWTSTSTRTNQFMQPTSAAPSTWPSRTSSRSANSVPVNTP